MWRMCKMTYIAQSVVICMFFSVDFLFRELFIVKRNYFLLFITERFIQTHITLIVVNWIIMDRGHWNLSGIAGISVQLRFCRQVQRHWKHSTVNNLILDCYGLNCVVLLTFAWLRHTPISSRLPVVIALENYSQSQYWLGNHPTVTTCHKLTVRSHHYYCVCRRPVCGEMAFYFQYENYTNTWWYCGWPCKCQLRQQPWTNQQILQPQL